MSANIELVSAENGQPPDAQAAGSSSESTSFVSARDVVSNNETNEDNNSTGSTVAEDQQYISSFQSSGSRHLMHHWRNVLSASRVQFSGSILLFWLQHGEGVQDREQLDSRCLDQPRLTQALAAGSNGERGPPQVVFVRDLSSRIINTLGPVFNLSPETFEEHLVQSGYTASSYSDPDSSTWPTRFLPKHHVSMQWFSLVLRKDMEPRDDSSRRQLAKDGLRWSRDIRQRGRIGNITFKSRMSKHELHTTTNIFRQEWPLSVIYHPPKRKLHADASGRAHGGLIEIGEDDGELDEADLDDADIVAWEERVTFCWGSGLQGRRRKSTKCSPAGGREKTASIDL
jgi:hypothetical protein